MTQLKWPDGTPKSQGNAFDWNTGERSIFARDQFFLAKGDTGLSSAQLAAMSRENAEANGKDIATIGGIGQIVIDKINSKSFHVYRRSA